jgi:hypothetical protein
MITNLTRTNTTINRKGTCWFGSLNRTRRKKKGQGFLFDSWVVQKYFKDNHMSNGTQ